MSLKQWLANGWLKPHRTDAAELANLLAIVDRDVADSTSPSLSDDWKFGIAYNAALKLCTMALYAAGYMPEKSLAHYRTLLSVEFTLGPHRKADAAYLDACRAKRNHVEYDYVQGASGAEAAELLAFVRELRREVIEKLAQTYPELVATKPPQSSPAAIPAPSVQPQSRGSRADAASAASAP